MDIAFKGVLKFKQELIWENHRTSFVWEFRLCDHEAVLIWSEWHLNVS